MQRFAAVTIALLFVLCAKAQAQPASPGGAALAADTPSKTPAGTTFTAPKEWSLQNSSFVLISAPEGDTNIAIVEIPSAANGSAAAAAAWALYRPAAQHPVRMTART